MAEMRKTWTTGDAYRRWKRERLGRGGRSSTVLAASSSLMTGVRQSILRSRKSGRGDERDETAVGGERDSGCGERGA